MRGYRAPAHLIVFGSQREGVISNVGQPCAAAGARSHLNVATGKEGENGSGEAKAHTTNSLLPENVYFTHKLFIKITTSISI